MSGAERRKKKLAVIDDLYAKFTQYEQIILVSLENVSSKQMGAIRRTIRDSPDAGKGATLMVGKNVSFPIYGVAHPTHRPLSRKQSTSVWKSHSQEASHMSIESTTGTPSQEAWTNLQSSKVTSRTEWP